MPTDVARKRSRREEPERLLQARLPAPLVKELRILALERDTTVKELLTRLVRDYLSQQRRGTGRRE